MSNQHKIYPEVLPINETRIRVMVQSMVHAKQTLAYNRSTDQDTSMDPCVIDYTSICQQIDQYIEQYCQHEFVYDWIDVDPEHSRRIQYCKHCEKTAN